MAWQLGLVLVKLKDIEEGARNHCTFLPNRDVTIPRDMADNLANYLRYARKQFASIELGQAVFRLTDNLIRELGDGYVSYDRLAHSCDSLLETVEAELQYRRFAYVPVERAEKLDKIDHDWANVQRAFPSAKTDIADAVECYALDKHTACIFHLMRVSEHGLRTLARKLHVALSDKGKHQPLEYADWDKIITAVKNRITDARRLPRGAAREARLQSWSEAADHCEYMKDNWRNAVSHTRKPYGPADALRAIERVHAFMEFLAKTGGRV